jgi:DNA polymerase-1
VDDKFLNDYSIELENMSNKIEESIYEMSGMAFNIASPKQLGEVLFDHLKIDAKAKRTKTGSIQNRRGYLRKTLY